MLEVTELLNGAWLVEGEDIKGNTGRTVLYSESWNTLRAIQAHQAATEEFEQRVEEFFAPIVKAADEAAAAVTAPVDDWAVVQIGETIEGSDALTLELDAAGVLLRLLDETDHTTLRWVESSILVAVA